MKACVGLTDTVMCQRIGNGVQLMHRAFNAIEHAIKRVGQLADLVVAACCRDPLIETGVTYPRSRPSDLADMAEHAPGGKEYDAETQKYDQQPQKKEAKAEFRQHPQLVPLGKSEIDMAAIAHLQAGYSKRDRKSGYAIDQATDRLSFL